MNRDERASILLEHTQDKIVVVDDEGRFVYANDAVGRILGYDPAELVGKEAFQFVHPEDHERVVATFERTVTSVETTSTTARYRYRRHDGSYVWLESRFSNVTDEALGGYVVSSRDVTDRVESEHDRAETTKRLTELTDVVDDVMWMFSGDWSELLFVNPAYEEVYGASRESLESDPASFLDAVHPDDREFVEEGLDRLSAGEPVDMEYRVNESREFGVWVWVSGQPIVEDGEVRRIVGFARDVTDRRRRERQLAVMDNLLRHNLRNAMTVVVGNAEVIARDADEPTAERARLIRRTGQQLVESADKQRRIIEMLTEHEEPEQLELTGLVASAVAAVRDHYDGDVETDLPARASAVAVRQLSLAVSELVENALVHGPEDVTVTVTVTVDEDWVAVEVRDDGPPIPETEVDVLTGDHEMTTVYHTTGLGLWLVNWVVDLSEGYVTFERDDSGNVVTVRVPRAENG